MKMIRSVLVALIALLTLSSSQDSHSTMKLLLIAHRHGDRTPIKPYPMDPFKDPKNWPDGFGELTIAGKKRLFALGKFLRKHYGDYLTDNPREVFVRSSGAQRCLMSVSMLLAGAYPPNGRWVWNNEFTWQPFPIQTEPRKIDGMLVPSSHCPAAEEELSRIRHSPEMKIENRKYAELFKTLSLNTGVNVTDLITAENIFDCLLREKENDKQMPPWLTDEMFAHLKHITDLTFYYDFSTKLAQRLRAGLFLKDLRHRIRYVIDHGSVEVSEFFNDGWSESPELKRFYLYSTHDSQTAAIMNALGNFNMLAPPYASSLIFELHQTNASEHRLKMFYLNDTYSENMIPWPLPGCEDDADALTNGCHVGAFFHAIEPVIPENWRRECRLDAEVASMFGSGINYDVVPPATTPMPINADNVDDPQNPHEEL